MTGESRLVSKQAGNTSPELCDKGKRANRSYNKSPTKRSRYTFFGMVVGKPGFPTKFCGQVHVLRDRVTYLVDVGQHTTTGNGSSDEQVELLVSSNGQLKMSGGYTLHSEILGGIS